MSVDPGHIRKTVHGISALKNTIADVGLLQPILVRQTDRGYTVIDGARRLKALRELNVQELIVGRDVIIESSETDADEKYRQLIANVQREDINDVELGYAFVTLKEQYGYDYKDIAAILGKSQHYVTAKVGLARRLTPEVRDLVVRDWENAKCIRDTFSGPSEDPSDVYVMGVDVVQDIARLPEGLQMGAYETIREKTMDKKEALRFLRTLKGDVGTAIEYRGSPIPHHSKDLDLCLKKIDREFENLSITMRSRDIDVMVAAGAIEKLIDRLNSLKAELNQVAPAEKMPATS